MKHRKPQLRVQIKIISVLKIYRTVTHVENIQPDKDYDSDDSAKDVTYKPSKKDINTSDSEAQSMSDDESEEDSLPLSLLIQKCVRNKGWKRKGKKIKVNRENKKCNSHVETCLREKLEAAKKRTARRRLQLSPRQSKLSKTRKSASFLRKPHRSTTNENELQTAKTVSRKENNLLCLIRRLHSSRLNNLLASNGLIRHEVKTDGNCLMQAVCVQLEERLSPVQLRNEVADHLLEYKHHNMNFLRFPEGACEIEKTELFKTGVSELKSNGKWNTDLGDCFPLAICNKLQRSMRIYSSKISNPVYDIDPNLSGQTGERLLLSLLAVRGTEHFDAVKKIEKSSKRTTSIVVEEKKTPVKNKQTDENIAITPHKEATYISPEKKQLFRKRKLNKEKWKRNINKRWRCAGEEYISSSGKKVPKRTLKHVNCSSCKFKCTSNITEEQRQSLFDAYWRKECYEMQRDFICQNVSVSQPKRQYGKTKRREIASKFSFKIGQTTIRVCKKFFLTTLDIGKKTVEYALKKQEHGTYQGSDMRGKASSANKIPEECVKIVHEHIKSFPTMESHYTRKKTKRKYLSSDLNITKMYTMYKEKCLHENQKPVSAKYRDIFCKSYNYSFHKPKKDQCSFCNLYQQQKINGTLSPEMEESYKEHQIRKVEGREEKGRDKIKAKEEKTFHACTFDLEAVLSTPCSLVGELYYKRKLSCYNLSFNSLGDKKGVCYLWDESQGGRGSSEIGSCLLMYISRLAENASSLKEITLYSDSCGGQNRNQFVSSALL